MTGKIFIALVCLPGLLLTGCGGKGGKNERKETPTSGTIHISVDESFKPVMDAEIKVFESSFPNAHVIPEYKAEAECFRDLLKDSTRMIIVTRELSKAEQQFYQDSLQYVPIFGRLAYDAIAVVINNACKDTLFTMPQIKSLLAGNAGNDLHAVMDGVSATSTVRYALDSVLKGIPLGKNVSAARSSQQVLDYVAKNKNAVGFVGVGWIGDQDDPDQLKFLEEVKVAGIRCSTCADGTYYKPYPANIARDGYPMVRGLYYILKENFRGVGNNFVNFLQLERGQLIFRRAYLIPSRMSFELRDMRIGN